MKILIVGSLHFNGSDEIRNEFIEASYQLGVELVRSNHNVVIGGESPNTADLYVVKGADSVKGKHEIIVCYPEKDEKKTLLSKIKNMNMKTFLFVIKRRKEHGQQDVFIKFYHQMV